MQAVRWSHKPTFFFSKEGKSAKKYRSKMSATGIMILDQKGSARQSIFRTTILIR
jgi:hypothetical protein